MRDTAIRNTHSTVVKIIDQIRAYDAGDIPVTLNESLITAEIARLEAAHTATQYQRDRAKAYPSIVDQLDLLYHSGVDGWKAQIRAVKDLYPKGAPRPLAPVAAETP